MIRSTRALTVLVAAAVFAALLPVASAGAAEAVCIRLAVTLSGTPSADSLPGTAGTDVISAGDGDDSVAAADGDDFLCGGPGNDLLAGDAGTDVIRGNTGDDVLTGGEGPDLYNGGPGTDICDLAEGDVALSGCELTFDDDPDQDGLTNRDELALGADPFEADTDGDSVIDGDEVTAGTDPATPEAGPLDADSDRVLDVDDNCVDVPNEGQADLDSDDEGDACDLDDDDDGALDAFDNCPALSNPGQLDTDSDGPGNACDGDDDGDGFADPEDLCPLRPNRHHNYSGCPPIESVTPPAEDTTDTDGDGIPDGSDNCTDDSNADQSDRDGDGTGDACDDAIPTFEEFLPDFMMSIGGLICMVLGLDDDECIELARYVYDLIFHGGPCICGPIPGIGVI